MALRRPSDIWNDNQVSIDVGDTLALSGNVTLDAGSLVGLRGNVTLDVGSLVGIRGNITLSNSKTFIGLVTVDGSVGISQGGNVATVDTAGIDAESNTSTRLNTRSHLSYFNGTTWDRTRGDLTNGLLVNLGANNDVTIFGNVTISDSKGFIGLTTIVEGIPYSSPSIVIGMTSSASGAIVQFAANAVKWVDVRASYANPTTCYVGGSNATVNNGFPLSPGDTMGIAITNTNQLYLVGVGTSEVRFLGGN